MPDTANRPEPDGADGLSDDLKTSVKALKDAVGTEVTLRIITVIDAMIQQYDVTWREEFLKRLREARV